MRQAIHCPLPQGKVTIGVPLPTAPGSAAVYRKSCIACPQVPWQCAEADPLPTAPRQGHHRSTTAHCPRQCGNVPQEFHCPLPQGTVVVCRSGSIAHCPKAVRRCAQGDLLPTTPRQCGSVTQEIHHQLPQGTATECGRQSAADCPKAMSPLEYHGRLTPRSAAVHRVSSTAYLLPTASRQCCGVPKRIHYPLPGGGTAV